MIYFIMAYWFLSVIFGNTWIQGKVGPLNTWYLLMGIGILYLFYYNFCVSKEKKKVTLVQGDIYGARFFNSVKVYAIVYLIYITLSMFRFVKIFNLDLDYEFSFILRQSYLIFCFPIMWMTVREIAKDPKRFEIMISDQVLIGAFLLLVIAYYFGYYDHQPYRHLIFGIASLYFLKNKNLLSFVMLGWTCAIGIFPEQSTGVLSVLAAVAVYTFYKLCVNFFRQELKVQIIFLAALIVLVFIIGFLLFGEKIAGDANSMWRLSYWMNELRMVRKTWGLGVGFGTAYGDNHFLNEVNNPNVFIEQVPAGQEAYALFVITQHSSVINVLYRMGVVGLITFLMIFFRLFQWIAKAYNRNSRYQAVLQWSMINLFFEIVIFSLNPGLESPRYMIGTMLKISIMVGVLLLEMRQRVSSNDLSCIL